MLGEVTIENCLKNLILLEKLLNSKETIEINKNKEWDLEYIKQSIQSEIK